MVKQKLNQTTNQKNIKAIPLCSKCIVHEISNWVADKRGNIDLEASQQIRQELKAVKLIPGECVVCNHNLISDNSFENILKVFDKHKIKKNLVEEFKRLFGFVI